MFLAFKKRHLQANKWAFYMKNVFLKVNASNSNLKKSDSTYNVLIQTRKAYIEKFQLPAYIANF